MMGSSSGKGGAAAHVGFNTPFQEQIDYLLQKLRVPTERWDDIQRSAHDRAFMVAGAAKADLLQDLHDAVVQRATDGKGLQAFRKDFKAIVAKHGWTGWTGEDSKEGVAWRTKVIYQTNMAQSYAAGRYRQMKDPEYVRLRPYWRYIHREGVRHPRPQHLAWHGLTLHHEHPFWDSHFPPNGFGCGCRVAPVSKAEGERSRNAGLGDPPDGWDAIDPNTGAPVGIDKGFDYAAGAGTKASLQSLIDAKLLKLTPELADAFRVDLNRLDLQSTPTAGSQSPRVIEPPKLTPIQQSDFTDFFNSKPGSPDRVVMTLLDAAEMALFGVAHSELWLSRTSLDEHRSRHPEVGIEDYLKIPDIVHNGAVWGGHQDRRYLLLRIADKPYRAAIKASQDHADAWFLSLVINQKQKPPKGAVLLRRATDDSGRQP